MKKVIISSVIGIVAVFIIGFAVLSVDFNRLNKEAYYVQITEDGVLETTKLESGEIMKLYEYKMNAINKDGENKELEFSANKNLKQEAYLKIYVKKGTSTVTSYDEVALKDLPEKVEKALK